MSIPCLLYLLQFGIIPRLSSEVQQLFFVLLDLLLETHVLLTNHSLKLQQLWTRRQEDQRFSKG